MIFAAINAFWGRTLRRADYIIRMFIGAIKQATGFTPARLDDMSH